MRVLVIASEYPPFVQGGLGTYVTTLTTELAAQGIEIDLGVPERSSYEPAPPGVRIRPITVTGVDASEGNTNYWVTFCAGVLDLLAGPGATNRAYDLVHCHDWVTALAGVLLRERARIPLVFSVHLPQATQPNLALEELGIAAADVALVLSAAARDEVAARNPDLSRCVVIPGGVDTERFLPPDPASPADRTIVFVGRLVPQKGVDILLRSFGVVRRRLPNAQLLIVGDGDQALYLRRLARYLGLPPQVKFLGWQTGADLVRLYQEASVVAVPSRYEPFGLVALEAMSCGRPVVASRVGGLSEVVCAGRTGFLVPPADHLRLAQRLIALLADDDQRRVMGECARQRALDYSWLPVADTTRQLYQSVLTATPPGPVREPVPQHLVAAAVEVLPPRTRAVAETLLSSSAPVVSGAADQGEPGHVRSRGAG